MDRHGQSEHFTAKIEVASQLRDKVLEVPCALWCDASRFARFRARASPPNICEEECR